MPDAFTARDRNIQGAAIINARDAAITNRENLETLKTNREIALSREERAQNQEERRQEEFERNRPSPEQLAMQNELITKQLQQALDNIDRTETYDAFDRYVADGDTRHLNQLMKNPRIKATLYGPEVVSVNPIDLENDKQFLRENGLTEDVFIGENADNAKQRFVKVTNVDGTVDLVDMQNVLAGTGYFNHATNEQLDIALKKSKISTNTGKGGRSGSDFSLLRNDARALQEFNPELTDEEAMEKVLALKDTAKQKDLREAETREDNLIENFGGTESFFNTDFNIPSNKVKASRDVEAIERLKGVKLSGPQQKKLSQVKTILALADTAGTNLSAKETGLFDNLLFNTKKYLTDEVGGAEGASAYAAYRNVVRNALYGSALTATEVQAFTEAFGSMKQQLGPVLTQLKVGVSQLQTDLEAIAEVQNPLVAHFRLGATEDEVSQVLDNLQERINLISGLETGGDGLEVLKPAPNLDQLPNGPGNVGERGQGSNPAINKSVDQVKPRLQDFKFSGE